MQLLVMHAQWSMKVAIAIVTSYNYVYNNTLILTYCMDLVYVYIQFSDFTGSYSRNPC